MKEFIVKIEFITVFIIVALCNISIGGVSLKLTDNGESNYEIVIKDNAPEVTRFAASELNYYLKKVANVDIPVKNVLGSGKNAIYVGEHSDIIRLGNEYNQNEYSAEESFLIAKFGENIVIMGADCDADPTRFSTIHNFGLLFGVYEFIERFLGVRWYAPGELGECFEERKKVKVDGLPIRQQASYWYRVYWNPVFNEASAKESIIWGRRMKGFGRARFSANHSMLDFHFAFKETDPEIFALGSDGERIFGKFNSESRRWEPYPQFCFSNPRTLEAFKEMVDAYYENTELGRLWKTRNPDENFIYVVPSDNFRANPCNCPKCQTAHDSSKGAMGVQSRLVWNFIAKVADWAKEKYPDKRVVGLAYEGYFLPPEGVCLPDNVITTICINPYIIYSGFPEYESRIEDIMRSWGEKVNEIAVWQYYLPYGDHPYMMPGKLYDWYLLHSDKVKAVFFQIVNSRLWRSNLPTNPIHEGRPVSSDLAQLHLNLYFTMKGLWGAPCDIEKELELYYNLFYGPASEPMRKFHQLAIKQWENVEDVKSGSPTHPNFSGMDLYTKIYPEAVLGQLEIFMDEACSLAPEGSVYAQRLDWINNSYFNAFVATARSMYENAGVNKVLTISPQKSKPKIDGKLDDDFWINKRKHAFQRLDAPLPSRFPTDFMFGMDANNIYLAITGTDPDSGSQTVNVSNRDGRVWMDDSYEIFVCPDADKPENYFQIAVNLNDVVMDVKYIAGEGDVKWDSGVTTVTARHDGFWISEVALPLSTMGIDPNKNSVIRFNLCRNKESGVSEDRERSQWGTTYGSFHNTAVMPRIYICSTDSYYEAFDNKASGRIRSHFYLKNKENPNGKIIREWVSTGTGDGILFWDVSFPARNDLVDRYAVLRFLDAEGLDITQTAFCEMSFENHDEFIDMQVVYHYKGVDGETYRDWFRVPREKIHRARFSFNFRTDGIHAQRSLKNDKSWAAPESVLYFAIIATCRSDQNYQARIGIDYIRFTANPIHATGKP